MHQSKFGVWNVLQVNQWLDAWLAPLRDDVQQATFHELESLISNEDTIGCDMILEEAMDLIFSKTTMGTVSLLEWHEWLKYFATTGLT